MNQINRHGKPKDNPFYSNAIGDASFTIGTEAANAIDVTVQLKDVDGLNLIVVGVVQFYLAADNLGLTFATAAGGGISGGANGNVKSIVAGITGIGISGITGLLDITITNVGAYTCYLVIVLPDGTRVVSPAIVIT